MKIFAGIAWAYVLLLMAISFVILTTPFTAYLFLLLSVGILFLLESMKLKLWLGFRKRKGPSPNLDTPLVSVHLAICNEPPSMVMATIEGILAQNYPHFELIIVDNNTSDSKVWRPVADFCEALPNVRFFHLENWPFYKSGALNFARKVSHESAEFIFVVDADYILTEDALSMAVANIVDQNIALVQFPQAYMCSNKKHVSIVEEFDHFFDYYCSKADTCYGALATGTLSLIRISALDSVDGWPTNSITEDAELGSRLQAANYDIKYVHKVIGKGIAPIHQEDFIKQRKRWIFGNMQTLRNYALRPWHDFEKWLSGVSQLTAWSNLLGLPILVLISCLFLAPWLETTTLSSFAVLAYTGYWIFSISKALRLQLVQGRPSTLAFKTFLVYFSSTAIGAFHWWPVLWGRERPFVRTDKSGSKDRYKINLLYPFLHLSLFFIALGAASPFVAVSALTFGILHIVAIRYDYTCRAEPGSGIVLNLKLNL